MTAHTTSYLADIGCIVETDITSDNYQTLAKDNKSTKGIGIWPG